MPFAAALLLPHAYPFLLLDQVLSVQPGVAVEALALPCSDTPFGAGGTLLPIFWLEAMAQAAGIAQLSGSAGDRADVAPPLLLGVEEFAAARAPLPGERALIEARIAYRFGALARAEARVSVGGEEVARARLTLAEGRD